MIAALSIVPLPREGKRGLYSRVGQEALYSRPIGLTARIGLALATNAIALLIVALIFDGVDISWLTFIIAVVIFSVISLLVTPIVTSLMRRYAVALASAASLAATFIALLVTDIVSSGLDIEGVGTWIGATLIVWLATMIVSFVFGLVHRPSSERS